MKTKMKKWMLGAVAFLSLVVSLIGVLPVEYVQAEIVNNIYEDETHPYYFKVDRDRDNIEEIDTSNPSYYRSHYWYKTSVSVKKYFVYFKQDYSYYYNYYLVADSAFDCLKASLNDNYGSNCKVNYNSLSDMHSVEIDGKRYYYYSKPTQSNSGKEIKTDADQIIHSDTDDFLKNDDAFLRAFITGTALEGMTFESNPDKVSDLKPYFYLASSQSKKNSILSWYWNCKWALTWKLPDGMDADKNYLEIYVSNDATKSDTVKLLGKDKGVKLSSGYYSFFTNPQVQEAMLEVYGDWRPLKNTPFYIYARSKDEDSNPTEWTIFQCYPDGRIGKVYGRDPETWDKTTEYKDKNGNYSDGSSVDANGSYYVPDSGYDPASDTDSSGHTKDYTWKDAMGGDGTNNTVNKDSFMGLLNDCIGTIGNVPAVLSALIPWIPEDIMSLICLGFASIVVVGVIKWVL